ncbi:MAG: pyrimidine/purine nucleoside phosphorylase [Deltaproteobacteria bacterium]
MPTEFSNVTVTSKANVYFDGKVVSHSLRFGDGSKKTIGLIYAGEYHFSTQAAERMEIVAGTCWVRLDGQTSGAEYGPGSAFDVPANSGFSIQVATGITEYICSFS